MKVGETGRSSGPVSVRRARARAAAEEAAPAAPRKVADTVSIMGIPEVELTPKVRAAIVTLMAEVESLRHEVEHTRERLAHLERLADQDPLAPIANRRAFVRELSRALSITERYGTPSSLVYFDVNGLKEINDTYGHTAGDEGLLRVASILREHVRDVDVVGRLGGDEFGVIMVQTELEPAFDKHSGCRPRSARTHSRGSDTTSPSRSRTASTRSSPARASTTRSPPPTGRCTSKSWRPRPPAAKRSRGPTQAIMSGRMSLSRRAIWSLSASLRFFSRCTWMGS